METKWSDERNELAAALAIAQGEIRTAAKENVAKVRMKSGGEFTYKYSTLDDVWDVARGPLSKNGLAVIQLPTNAEGGLLLETTLLHSSGQWVTSSLILPVVADRMSALQAMGSAITYARRYTLGAMLGITTSEDDDGKVGGTPPPEKKKSPPAATPPNGNGQSLPALTPVQQAAQKAKDDFLAKTKIELGLTDDQVGAILKELGHSGFKPDLAAALFEDLDAQINQGVTTETALLVMANRETDGHYKHLKHVRNTVKNLNLGLDYPPRIDEPVNWQAFLAGLIEHANAPE